MQNKIADPAHVQRVRSLYKIIMKLHRGLPQDMKTLGDMYAREEFKRHKKCNPAEANIFMNEWVVYAMTLSKQLGLKGPKTSKPLGINIDEEDLEKLRDDQIQQLYELMLAAKGIHEDDKNNKKDSEP
ncbi:hypothetical protein J437_LFUL010446 [Ladona fulva]|uniref:Succinate dehydrogenase assembly factor 3 n=1 Tax=Ladona fulva TaxID=123851 RepID=A0A8K0KCD2_LADFU|nr:hypothetical protein J437_LFUL010446 [Ladona fulva]